MTGTPSTPAERRRSDGVAGHVGTPLATVTAGAVLAAVATADLGPRGAVSALVGTAVVVLFFWTGTLPLQVVRREQDRAAFGLVVLLMNYALRLLLVVMALALADRADAVDARWTGLTVIAGTLVWVAAQVAAVSRPRAPM